MKRFIAAIALVLLSSACGSDKSPAPKPDGVVGGSGITGGGDVVTEYLETIRASFKSALAQLIKDPTKVAGLCANEPQQLTDDQIAQCRDFIGATMNEMYHLAAGPKAVEFERDAKPPLLVADPFGRSMQVDASTSFDENGPIEVDFDRVRSYPPATLLRLVAHEFGHKVDYRGTHVTDNDSYGAFPRGRQFMDAVGEAIADFAKSKNLIGSDFTIEDRYFCQIRTSPSASPTGTQCVGYRHAQGSDASLAYETGFGDDPLGGLVFQNVLVSGKAKCLWLHLKTHEESGCSQTQTGTRWTKLQVTETDGVCIPEASTVAAPSIAPTEDIVAEQDFASENPACDAKPTALSITALSVNFKCQYAGFVALAHGEE